MIIGVDASRAFVSKRTGTENYSFQLIKHMLMCRDADKHRFVLFTRKLESDVPEWANRKNVEVVEIKMPRLWTQLGLARETWRRKLDLLFVPAHTLPVFRRPGIRTVVTIHGLEYEWLPEYKNLLQRWYLPLSTMYAVRSADRLIAVSEFTRKQIIERLGADSDKIFTIHEGVDQEFFEKKRAESFVETTLKKFAITRPYVLFVGTLQPRKNLPFLIQTMSYVRGVQLVLAGGPGWMTEGIYEAPTRYGMKDRVVFTGRIEDEELAVLMQQANLYVQSSVTEGFGLPIIEAMAAGTAVVTSNGGALREVAGDAAFAMDEFDVEKWARKISELCESSQKRVSLIRKGAKRVEHFSWQRCAKMTLKTLVEIA